MFFAVFVELLVVICNAESTLKIHHPANMFLFKVNNRNTRKKCEIRPNLTIKTQERRQ